MSNNDEFFSAKKIKQSKSEQIIFALTTPKNTRNTLSFTEAKIAQISRTRTRTRTMSDKEDIKYSTEIWEVTRVFSRLAKNIYGMAIALTCWLVLMKTGSDPLTSKDTVDGLWIPTVETWYPFVWKLHQPSMSRITVLGFEIILLWWLFYSGYISYIRAIANHAVKPIVFLAATTIILITLAANTLLLPATFLTKKFILANRRQKFKRKWLEDYHANHPEQSAEAHQEAWETMLSELIKKHSKSIVDAGIEHGTWTPTNFMILKAFFKWTTRLLQEWLTHRKIGLTPVMAFSHIEEFNAAKLPLLVFAQAINRINSELRDFSLLGRIKLVELPAIAKIRKWSDAIHHARIFDTDTLLWGTYKDGEEKIIHMNILCRHHSNEEVKEDNYGLTYQSTFFPREINISTSSVTFNQEDSQEVYLVLLLAKILTLQKSKSLWSNGWIRVTSIPKLLDQFNIHGEETIQKVLARLIPLAMGNIAIAREMNHKDTSIRVAIADLAGQWIGTMLNVSNNSSSQQSHRTKPIKSSIKPLIEIGKSCIEIRPSDPIPHYRLGSLYVIAGEQEKAIQHFTKAGTLEENNFQDNSSGASVTAYISMLDISRHNNAEIEMAVWAAHAACTINSRDTYLINNIRKMVEEDIPKKLHYNIIDLPEPPAIQIIKAMLPKAEQKQ